MFLIKEFLDFFPPRNYKIIFFNEPMIILQSNIGALFVLVAASCRC